MSIFNYQDYKLYVNARFGALPKQGHGEYRRMSQSLKVSTTLISQVFRGDKQLSLEMAADLCDYLRLEDLEAQYFLLLVEYQKSGSTNLKEKLLRRIQEEQKRSLTPRKKPGLSEQKELSPEDKVTYYSSWVYAGIRNLCAVNDFGDVQQIAARLGLPVFHVANIVEFLLSRNLLTEDQGRLQSGPAIVGVPAKSPLMGLHHHNWRLQALQKLAHPEDQNLFFTAPMPMSKEAAQKIRAELPEFISRITKMLSSDESEVVRCLNIDFFEF